MPQIDLSVVRRNVLLGLVALIISTYVSPSFKGSEQLSLRVLISSGGKLYQHLREGNHALEDGD